MQASKQLKLDILRSPGTIRAQPSPKVLPAASPMKDQSPFRYPDSLQPSGQSGPAIPRRDSIFERPAEAMNLVSNKLSKINNERESLQKAKDLESVALSSSNLMDTQVSFFFFFFYFFVHVCFLDFWNLSLFHF